MSVLARRFELPQISGGMASRNLLYGGQALAYERTFPEAAARFPILPPPEGVIMGFEAIIAVLALVVAGIALARSSTQSDTTEATRVQVGFEQHEESHSAAVGTNDHIGEQSSLARAASDLPSSQLTSRVQRLEAEIATLEQQVVEHASLFVALVTDDEARHLWFLERGDAVNYDSHPALEQELRSLTRRGLIEKRGVFKIHELHSPFNLVEAFQLTSLGKLLLQRRQHMQARDVAPADSLPPGPSVQASTAPKASIAAPKASASG